MKRIINDALDNIKQFQSRIEDIMSVGITVTYYKNNQLKHETVDLSEFVRIFNEIDNSVIQRDMLIQYFKRTETQIFPIIKHNLDLLFVQLTELEKLTVKPEKEAKNQK